MKFTIKKDEFAKSLNIVSKAIVSNSEDPLLKNIKLELVEDCLFLTGSNGALTIKTFIPYNVEGLQIIRDYKEGSILLNAKHLIDTISKIKTNEVIFEVFDGTAIITSDNGKSKKELNTIPADEYYDVDLNPEGHELTLSKKIFVSTVSQTAFATSAKDKNILTAINFIAKNGELTVTATDSNRMAVKKIPISEELNFVANIPAKTLVEISHLIESNEDVSCFFADKKVIFSFDRTTVSSSLVVGEYPKTEGILARRITNYTLQINASELINAIESTRIMSIDRENIVDLSMSQDAVQFSAKSSQAGSALEEIETFKYEGEPLKISFNSDFVLSAVRGLGSVDVIIKFEAVMKPFLIVDPLDDSITQIVTPVRPFN